MKLKAYPVLQVMYQKENTGLLKFCDALGWLLPVSLTFPVSVKWIP